MEAQRAKPLVCLIVDDGNDDGLERAARPSPTPKPASEGGARR
jgi:hypothetical protein